MSQYCKSKKQILELFTSIDVYGRPFTLTFKGQKTFKTPVGALATGIIFVTLVSYISYKSVRLFCKLFQITTKDLEKEDNKIGRYVLNEAQNDNPDIIDVQQVLIISDNDTSERGFDIAFGGYNDISPKYGHVSAVHYTKTREIDSVTNKVGNKFILAECVLDNKFENQQLELIKCKDLYFNYPRKNESAYLDVADLLCIKDKSMLKLGGAWTTKRLQEIDICLAPCENSTANNFSCAPQTEIETYFKDIRYVNQYFDFDDLEQPVKKYIEDRYFIPVQTFQQKGMEIFIKKSFPQLNDDYNPFSRTKYEPFVQVDNFIEYTSKVNYYMNCYVKVILRVDLEYEIYTRQVYTFADLLTDLGGIFSALFAIGSISVSFISENMFYSQIIKDVYQTQSYNDKKVQSSNQNDFESQRDLDKHSISDQSPKTALFQSPSNTSQKRLLWDFSSETNILEKVLVEIQSRLRFKYNFKNIIQYTFKCYRRKHIHEKKSEDKYRRMFLFEKGIKKIDHEFDAISLCKHMKQLKLLTSVLLDPTQKLLLGFQRKNALDSESSDHYSDDDDDVQIIKKMKTKNEFVRLMCLGRIKTQLKEYFDKKNGRFKEIDQRLFEGIMNKHLDLSKRIASQGSPSNQFKDNDNTITTQNLHSRLMKMSFRLDNSAIGKSQGQDGLLSTMGATIQNQHQLLKLNKVHNDDQIETNRIDMKQTGNANEIENFMPVPLNSVTSGSTSKQKLAGIINYPKYNKITIPTLNKLSQGQEAENTIDDQINTLRFSKLRSKRKFIKTRRGNGHKQDEDDDETTNNKTDMQQDH
ncbi:UNKNOWN [Stylonychia lemnae]|uniref:Uncharacterized protein n=1 Tax=Stylonychia lemnae TaxID=5949 RepID=A0A077ZYL9_STYLE|nr:UNKNOWN [Stylonychia lemnae]|eukprot:CDW74282.1 UNKNOWN [Stylonychia lemnae]